MRTSAGRAVGDDPAVRDDDQPREEVRGQPQVVEDGDERRAVALVEVAQELHGLDLVAQVEVHGGLVEQQDRRLLRDREREQDQLPLARATAPARRGPGGGPGPPGRSPPRRRPDPPGVAPRSALSCGRRPSATTSSTRIENGSAVCWGTTASRRAISGRSRVAIGVPSSSTRPAAGRSVPARTRSSVDLPAPLGPISATRSPCSSVKLTSRRIARPRASTVTPSTRNAGAAHSSYPVRARRSRARKNGAPMTAVTTPTGMSPASRAARSANDQEVGAPDGRDRQHGARVRPRDQPHEVRDDEAHEPDQAADRDGGRRHQRRERQQHRPLPAHVDPEVAGRLLAEEQRVERARAGHDHDRPDHHDRRARPASRSQEDSSKLPRR